MARARTEASEDRLEKLLVAEQTATTPLRIPFWRNWGDIAAVAAVLVLFVGIVLPALGYARQRYQQQRCQTQLAGVYDGVARYVADHDGHMPRVPTAPGSPWWKVGYQGVENVSNTRRAWLLVKEGYVDPSRFICPGRPESRDLRFDTLQVANYNDFPGTAYIHFSIRVGCPQSKQQGLTGRRVLFADRNPLSEKLPTDYSTSFSLRLCKDLMTSNSSNHNRRGQNVLFCDGSVEFTRRRNASVSEDDIYTLSNMTDGCEVRGHEVPSCDTDAFLAP
jgi:prepilin-type processing-associated H-X9-DG protein